MRRLLPFFWITDVAFVIYWLVTFLGLIPEEYLYQDYKNPNLVAWNLSFFPLDILISITGFASLHAYHNGQQNWRQMAILSLTLTFCSGLQAISFWIFKADFDLAWWIPNLFLLLYPLFFLPGLVRKTA